MFPLLFLAGSAALILSGCSSDDQENHSKGQADDGFDQFSRDYQNSCEDVPELLEREPACDAASIDTEKNIVGTCSADLYIPPSTQDLRSLLGGSRCQSKVVWQATSNHIDGHVDVCEALVTSDHYGKVEKAELLGEYDDYSKCEVR